MGVVTNPQPVPPNKGTRGLRINLTIVVVAVVAFVIWRNQSKEKDVTPAQAAPPATTSSNASVPSPAPEKTAAADPATAPSTSAARSAAGEAPAAKVTPQAADDIDAFAKDMMNPKNGFYDPHYKVAGKFPEGWVVRGAPRWGTEETTIFFEDPQFPQSRPSLYYRMFPEPMQKSPADVQAWLREEATKKEQQRMQTYPDYLNGEMKLRTIGDRPALSWTATYSRNGEPWTEYLTRIYTPKGTYLFFMQAPEKDLPSMMPRFERVITTTIMP